MSRYKPYSSYKESGVEWLGEVPEHWNVKRLKNVIRAPITDGPHETPIFINEGIPFLSVDGIQDGELTFEKCRYISYEAHQSYSKKAYIQLDDILLGKAASIGKVARVKVDFEFSIWSPLALIKPKLSEIKPSYLEYLLKSTLTQYQIQQLSTSNTQQNISMGDIPKFVFSLPAIEEQTAIVNFLDRETSKIDILISKQERMIVLLNEKRSALISHAVTKGIDSNVKMRDSGIVWLGEVPEHWEVKRLQYVLNNIKAGPFGSSLTKDMYTSEGYRVYGQEQVIPNDFSIGDYYISQEQYLNLQQYKVQTGDILISCVGTFGKIAVVPDKIEPGIINPRLIRMRANELVIPNYLMTVMRSIIVFEQFSLLSRGGTMDIINIGTLSSIVLAIPPKADQLKILDYLDSKTTKIDTLIAKARQAIELMKERRTALISAAVTGKIDVREIQ